MRIGEKLSRYIRHSKHLEQAAWLWNALRPAYDKVLAVAGLRGLERIVNGTDVILISPRYRSVSEEYESEVWHSLMSEVKEGDVVADVGTFIGLYTIALAKRVGPSGHIVAFEPNPLTFSALQEHVVLNSVADRVELIQSAIGASSGMVSFELHQDESRIRENVSLKNESDFQMVDCQTLDSVLSDSRLDLMKIDVEGYEQEVLQGAVNLLTDPNRSPRAIYIEVHPQLWSGLETNSESLLSCLARCDYAAFDLAGQPVDKIEHYGEIVARKRYHN